MASTRGQVVRAALQLEKDGKEFYLSAAGRTDSDLGRKMFESLAADEERHAQWIEDMSSEGVTAEDANRALYDRLRPIFADAPADTRLSVELSQGDIEAIDVAIGMEDKSIAAYQEWFDGEASGEVKSLCDALVGQERFHKELLENTKVYLDAPADWFMQEEQWNFEGG